MVLAVAAMPIAPNPTPSISSNESGYEREAPRRTSPTPSTIAPPAIRDGFGLRPNASHSAASSDPTPDAAIRKP